MSEIISYIKDMFYYIANQFASMEIIDFVDIIIVSVLIYYTYIFLRERRAGKLAAGLLFLLAVMWLSDALNMKALHFIIEMLVNVGLIAIIVIFQPELRSALEKMGGNSLKGLNMIGDSKTESEKIKLIEEISIAAGELSESKTGALIVIERTTRLGDEIKTGVIVDAEVSTFLIGNIFYNKAPLHDGAMIIRNGRIYACGCFLPLSHNEEITKDLGTRHRAALGVSEISDAIVIVVSEETGIISVVKEGELKRGFNRYSLNNELITLLELNQERKNPIIKLKRR